MARKLQIKRGMKANMPTLAEGELGFAKDEKKVYIGTGAENVPVSVTRPTRAKSTMTAAGWNKTAKTYSFEDTYPHAQYDIEVAYAKTCTTEQLDAWNGAMLAGDIESNVVTALGDVPVVDIPIILEVVKV